MSLISGRHLNKIMYTVFIIKAFVARWSWAFSIFKLTKLIFKLRNICNTYLSTHLFQMESKHLSCFERYYFIFCYMLTSLQESVNILRISFYFQFWNSLWSFMNKHYHEYEALNILKYIYFILLHSPTRHS